MEPRRGTVSVFRAALMWLLALCVFFGPAGAGTSNALAAATPDDCDVECPCDDAEKGHDEADVEHDCDGEELHADEGEPCEDLCPDSCHECSCCFSVAVQLDVLPQLRGPRARSLLGLLAPRDAPANGTRGNIFRPPRSRN